MDNISSEILIPKELALRWVLLAIKHATSWAVIKKLALDFYNEYGELPNPSALTHAPQPGFSISIPESQVASVQQTLLHSGDQNSEPPLPTPAVIPQAQPVALKTRRYSNATNFDYRADTPYRREACRQLLSKISRKTLPETHLSAEEFVNVEIALHALLPKGCVNLYTLLLAWSHFPAFLDIQEKPLGYFTLGVKRMASELGVKNGHIYTWLTILQQHQLVEFGNLNSGFLSLAEYENLKKQLQYISRKPEIGARGFFERAVQTNSTFYRILLANTVSLPKFNPVLRDTLRNKIRLVTNSG